jgi:prepilin-type N-terminal cleavage/methylation domain-containing protein
MKSKKGFTLIELLVVIAIIGILASVILTSLNSARAKTRDAQRISQFRNVQTALQLYYDKYGTYPPNVDSTGPWYNNFNVMAQVLVNEGFLGGVPVAPSYSPGGEYAYYNYGPGYNGVGALLQTSLETIPPSTAPYGASCRPFVHNWCATDVSDREYCICNPY